MVKTIPSGARVLLGGAVDYAGLFPPAALSMSEAVAEYQRSRAAEESWALGRFVVPAPRLGEFGSAARDQSLLPTTVPFGISALVGDAVQAHHSAIEQFNLECRGQGGSVDAVECRASTMEEVRGLAERFGEAFECWIEVPLDANLPLLLDAMAATPARPKIRMGGVEPGAFPGVDEVVQFLAAVVDRGLPFKATAGLHHPVRGEFRLTYDPDSPSGAMYGYLNLLLATALLQAGGTPAEARSLLLTSDPAAFAIDDLGATWGGRQFSLAALGRVRTGGMRAFGSCSFREPLSELLPLMVP